MSRSGIIAFAGFFALALGLASGLAIGSSREEPGSSSGRQQPRSEGPGDMPAPRELNKPDPLPLEAGSSTPPDVLKVAQELWDLMTSDDDGRSVHHKRQASMRDLRPEMASFFIRKFRELAHSMKTDRQMAMEMAIGCGGPHAVDFVRELGENPAEGFQEFMLRTVVADVLSNGHLGRRPKEFPVDEAMMQQTQILLASSRGTDRRLAVAILGRADAHRALPVITDRLRSDPDPVVRQETILQLGRIGNAASLDFLRTQGTAIADQIFSTYVQPQPVRGGAPVRVTDRRWFLRVLSDAIEELEERLQPK